jgi:hypothetical protein
MTKPPKRPSDANHLAKRIADLASGESDDNAPSTDDGKDPLPWRSGARGGSKAARRGPRRSRRTKGRDCPKCRSSAVVKTSEAFPVVCLIFERQRGRFAVAGVQAIKFLGELGPNVAEFASSSHAEPGESPLPARGLVSQCEIPAKIIGAGSEKG